MKYMDKITQIDQTPCGEEHRNVVEELIFADDQCLLHSKPEHLQDHMTALHNNCSRYNMKINTEKTEIMVINREHTDIQIKIDNQALKQVSEFKYLGSFFTEDGRCDREIETRIQQANKATFQLSPILKHPAIKIEIKRNIINAVFIPTLCYQCQTWTLNKDQVRKINTCEMRCLRKAVNKTRRDQVRNEEIRKTVGTTPVINFIENQRLKWFGHLMRMNPTMPAARAYNQRRESARCRGRPRRRWIEGVKDILKRYNTTTHQATKRALSRTSLIK